jgi:hypothetical protein
LDPKILTVAMRLLLASARSHLTLTVTDPTSGEFDACTATVFVVDNEPLVAICVPGPNPAGLGLSGLSIEVEDTGLGRKFAGPFTEGANVKYAQKSERWSFQESLDTSLAIPSERWSF